MPSFPARRLAAAITVTASLLALPAAASAKVQPIYKTFTQAAAYGIFNPAVSPVGVNDFTCKPSAAHPRPVVLLHGTFANRFNSFSAMGPALKAAGYCVFAPNYGRGLIPGVNGTTSIISSSHELALYVTQILDETKSRQVDLVGYSQGGLLARQYVQFDGGTSYTGVPSDNRVNSVIGLSVDNQGTTFGGITKLVKTYGQSTTIAALGKAAIDEMAGSVFLTNLNAGSQTVAGVPYTMIGTKTDEVSTPYTNAFLTAGEGGSVNNITLQNGCPTDLSDHFNITYSPRAIGLVLKALDPTYSKPLPCSLLMPLL